MAGTEEPVVRLEAQSTTAEHAVAANRATRHGPSRRWPAVLAAGAGLLTVAITVILVLGGGANAPGSTPVPPAPPVTSPGHAGRVGVAIPTACQTAIDQAQAALAAAAPVARALRRHQLLMERIDAGGVALAEVQAGRAEVASGVMAAARLDAIAAQFQAAATDCR
jgi:hypothetical protein